MSRGGMVLIILPDRCHSLSPNSLHQGREGRLQGHGGCGSACWRLQVAHRPLQDRPRTRRGHRCRLCSASRRWRYRIPCRSLGCWIPCDRCCEVPEQTVLVWSTSMRRYRQCYQVWHDRGWHRCRCREYESAIWVRKHRTMVIMCWCGG